MNSREPAEFVREILHQFPIHRDHESASLVDKMLSASPETDPWSLDLNDAERRLLGRILADNPEPPTIEEAQSSLVWLSRRRLARHAEQLIRDLRAADAHRDVNDPTAVDDLVLAKRVVRRAIRLLEGLEC